MIKDVDDPFLRQGIELTVDGTDPEQIARDPRGRDRRQACRRQDRRQVLRGHGRLCPDPRHHRHRHRPHPRARQPQEPRGARPPHRRRVRRDAVGVLSAPTRCGCRWPTSSSGSASSRSPRWSWCSRASSASSRHQPAAGGAEAALDPAGRRREGRGRPRCRGSRWPAAAARRPAEEEHENHERWLLTYADMITLLMVLFIVLFAIGQVDQKKFDKLHDGLANSFGQPTVLEGSNGLLEGSAAAGSPSRTTRVATLQSIAEPARRGGAGPAGAGAGGGARRQPARWRRRASGSRPR